MRGGPSISGEQNQAIGRSRGGFTSKIHGLTDVLGRPGVLLLTPGNASDVTTAPAVLAEAPGRVRRLAADKGYYASAVALAAVIAFWC